MLHPRQREQKATRQRTEPVQTIKLPCDYKTTCVKHARMLLQEECVAPNRIQSLHSVRKQVAAVQPTSTRCETNRLAVPNCPEWSPCTLALDQSEPADPRGQQRGLGSCRSCNKYYNFRLRLWCKIGRIECEAAAGIVE
jgi:hypothetical protein